MAIYRLRPANNPKAMPLLQTGVICRMLFNRGYDKPKEKFLNTINLRMRSIEITAMDKTMKGRTASALFWIFVFQLLALDA